MKRRTFILNTSTAAFLAPLVEPASRSILPETLNNEDLGKLLYQNNLFTFLNLKPETKKILVSSFTNTDIKKIRSKHYTQAVNFCKRQLNEEYDVYNALYDTGKLTIAIGTAAGAVLAAPLTAGASLAAGVALYGAVEGNHSFITSRKTAENLNAVCATFFSQVKKNEELRDAIDQLNTGEDFILDPRIAKDKVVQQFGYFSESRTRKESDKIIAEKTKKMSRSTQPIYAEEAQGNRFDVKYFYYSNQAIINSLSVLGKVFQWPGIEEFQHRASALNSFATSILSDEFNTAQGFAIASGNFLTVLDAFQSNQKNVLAESIQVIMDQLSVLREELHQRFDVVEGLQRATLDLLIDVYRDVQFIREDIAELQLKLEDLAAQGQIKDIKEEEGELIIDLSDLLRQNKKERWVEIRDAKRHLFNILDNANHIRFNYFVGSDKFSNQIDCFSKPYAVFDSSRQNTMSLYPNSFSFNQGIITKLYNKVYGENIEATSNTLTLHSRGLDLLGAMDKLEIRDRRWCEEIEKKAKDNTSFLLKIANGERLKELANRLIESNNHLLKKLKDRYKLTDINSKVLKEISVYDVNEFSNSLLLQYCQAHNKPNFRSGQFEYNLKINRYAGNLQKPVPGFLRINPENTYKHQILPTQNSENKCYNIKVTNQVISFPKWGHLRYKGADFIIQRKSPGSSRGSWTYDSFFYQSKEVTFETGSFRGLVLNDQSLTMGSIIHYTFEGEVSIVNSFKVVDFIFPIEAEDRAAIKIWIARTGANTNLISSKMNKMFRLYYDEKKAPIKDSFVDYEDLTIYDLLLFSQLEQQESINLSLADSFRTDLEESSKEDYEDVFYKTNLFWISLQINQSLGENDIPDILNIPRQPCGYDSFWKYIEKKLNPFENNYEDTETLKDILEKYQLNIIKIYEEKRRLIRTTDPETDHTFGQVDEILAAVQYFREEGLLKDFRFS